MGVYFIRAKGTNLVKIGHSANIQKRLEALQVGCPHELELLGVIKYGTTEIEACIHQEQRDDLLRGEWFDLQNDIIEELFKKYNVTDLVDFRLSAHKDIAVVGEKCSTFWIQVTQDYLATFRPATARQYRAALDDFAEWYRGTYGEDPDPALLIDEEAREWRGYLSGVRKLAASTVNARLAAVKGLAQHVGRELNTKGVKQVQQPIDVLTARELGRLLAAIEGHRWGSEWMVKRNLAIVATMARAGLRVSEVVALDGGDVELNTRSGWATIRQGKGLKERKVPLSLEARKALRVYRDARPGTGEAFFITKNGRRLSKRAVQDMVKAAAQRAGISKPVTPHTLRHTFATRFLDKGGDLAALRDILGHANIATTSKYLHPTALRMQAQVEDL